ncbi:HNH endonuclease [Sphingomonas sp. UYP23]
MSTYHGGTARKARQAVIAARVERLRKAVVQRAEPVEKSIRLRPAAREDPVRVSRWNCRSSWQRRRPTRALNSDVWFPKDKQESDNRRLILILVQGSLCALCGKYLDERDRESDTLRPSIDHMIPRDLGGTNRFNVVAAHSACNAQKQNDLPTGCELIWLLLVNARMRALPENMQGAFYR